MYREPKKDNGEFFSPEFVKKKFNVKSFLSLLENSANIPRDTRKT